MLGLLGSRVVVGKLDVNVVIVGAGAGFGARRRLALVPAVECHLLVIAAVVLLSQHLADGLRR